jgi:tRNA dimethylallyltransferase
MSLTLLETMHNKLIVILGPTASGKSDLAIKLAEKFKGEIVNADSRQIYQEMDIGTAKTKKIALVDIVKPNQEFTLAQYKKLAVKTIQDIQKRNRLPFLVGGTGLYIQAVVDNLKIPRVKPDKKLRIKLEKLSNRELFQRLKKLDSLAASAIDSRNKRRLIRALEVCLLTKKPFSKQKQKGQPLFEILEIGLKLNKGTLNKKIEQRVKKMLRTGLIEEVKKLSKKYSFNQPALSSIGYQEIHQCLQGKISLKKAEELIINHTRQYARRQMTWFKRDKRINWVKTYSDAKRIITDFI